ncbi:MAG: YbaN family protein [Sphaerochaetaceae bacterium]|nr:YbaN family protein [Candidatus Cloacimonadota bacterium]
MRTEKKRNKKTAKQSLLIVLGSVFVVMGAIGVVLPLLPTTPFVLLASACYSLSSPKLARKLEQSRVLGSYLRHWRTGEGVPLRTKILAIGWLWLGLIISMVIAHSQIVYIVLPIIGTTVTFHIAMIRNKHKITQKESENGVSPFICGIEEKSATLTDETAE